MLDNPFQWCNKLLTTTYILCHAVMETVDHMFLPAPSKCLFGITSVAFLDYHIPFLLQSWGFVDLVETQLSSPFLRNLEIFYPKWIYEAFGKSEMIAPLISSLISQILSLLRLFMCIYFECLQSLRFNVRNLRAILDGEEHYWILETQWWWCRSY